MDDAQSAMFEKLFETSEITSEKNSCYDSNSYTRSLHRHKNEFRRTGMVSLVDAPTGQPRLMSLFDLESDHQTVRFIGKLCVSASAYSRPPNQSSATHTTPPTPHRYERRFLRILFRHIDNSAPDPLTLALAVSEYRYFAVHRMVVAGQCRIFC